MNSGSDIDRDFAGAEPSCMRVARQQLDAELNLAGRRNERATDGLDIHLLPSRRHAAHVAAGPGRHAGKLDRVVCRRVAGDKVLRRELVHCFENLATVAIQRRQAGAAVVECFLSVEFDFGVAFKLHDPQLHHDGKVRRLVLFARGHNALGRIHSNARGHRRLLFTAHQRGGQQNREQCDATQRVHGDLLAGVQALACLRARNPTAAA